MAEKFELVEGTTRLAAVVRVTYESGKQQPWTLGALLEQRTALEHRIARGEELGADMAALLSRIGGVASVVNNLPDVVSDDDE